MKTLLFVAIVAVSTASVEAQQPAFPGADGYGKFVSGGRGGRVIAVTNLDDDGPGSLRDALRQSAARTLVFRVSGTIALKSPLLITNGDLTIAGQTAPGYGICIKNYNTKIIAENVIVRFIRFRLGDKAKQEDDAFCVMSSKNVIIDHCSMSWGTDEVGSFYDNENFTLQWSIISESLNNSVHSKGPHGYGGIWGGQKASFHHNLIAHNTSRNPRFNGGRTSGKPDKELVDFRNNLVYNWGFKCAYGGEHGKQNLVANYFKPGPASLNRENFLEPFDATGKWFIAENVVEGSASVTDDNWAGVEGEYNKHGRMNEPFPFVIAKTDHPTDIVPMILQSAGVVFPRRDAVDERIVREAQSGTASFGNPSYAAEHKFKKSSTALGIIDSQSEVGGWPTLNSASPPMDTDGDGMPDEWEHARKMNPNDPQDGAAISKSGYSNLEVYLNELVKKAFPQLQ
ncbi:MAG: pectate lyase [Ignavibacteriae bacterium]|nr:pectate lyase [Ignavibacteriota bacterium]